MSSSTRKRLRIFIACCLLITLPVFGFLLGSSGHLPSMIIVGAVVALGLVSLELITLSIERDLKLANLRLRQDVAEFDAWHEKVRQLDRIVALISKENQELRHERLDATLQKMEPIEV